MYSINRRIRTHGYRQLFRTGGANKVKTKDLPFGSRGRVQEGDPLLQEVQEQKIIFFTIQEL